MHITDFAASGRTWPHQVPSADGSIVGPGGTQLPMPPQPHPYLARMARFTDGAEHAVRRAAVMDVLPPLPGLEDSAYDITRDRIAGRDDVDVAPIARTVPVAVLGARMGVGDLSDEICALCDAGTVSDSLPDVATTSVLFQCRDATAALILNAVAGSVPVEGADSVVLTRRAGDVWVLLESEPFGAGAHACPGREHALALARGVVRAFAGCTVVDRGDYESRPNIRIPSRLVVRQRPGGPS